MGLGELRQDPRPRDALPPLPPHLQPGHEDTACIGFLRKIKPLGGSVHTKNSL